MSDEQNTPQQKNRDNTKSTDTSLPPDLQAEVEELEKKVDRVASVADSILKREK